MKEIWIIYEGFQPLKDEFGAMMAFTNYEKANEYAKSEGYELHKGFIQM